MKTKIVINCLKNSKCEREGYNWDNLSPTECIEEFVNVLKTEPDLITFSTLHGYIVNFIGGLVSKKILSTENISVYAVYEEHSEYYFFDEKGFLRGNWPYGFFDPDYYTTDELEEMLKNG